MWSESSSLSWPVKSSIGEMSERTSATPCSRNHSKDSRCTAIRSGSSSTSRSLEKERRSRDAREANVTPECSEGRNDRAAGARCRDRGTQRRHGRADTTVEQSSGPRCSRARDTGEQTPTGSACWRQDTTRPRPRSRFSRGSVQITVQLLRWPTPSELSVTEASRRGVARLVADAAHGDRGGGRTPRARRSPRWSASSASPSSTQLARRPARPRAGVGRAADDDGRRTRSTTWSTRSAAPGAADGVATVVLTDAALDDLRRAGPVARRAGARAARALLEPNPTPGAPLVDERTGLPGARRARTAPARIVLRPAGAATRDRPRGVGRRRAAPTARPTPRRSTASRPPTRRSRSRWPGSLRGSAASPAPCPCRATASARPCPTGSPTPLVARRGAGRASPWPRWTRPRRSTTWNRFLERRVRRGDAIRAGSRRAT